MSEKEPRYYDKAKIPALPKGMQLGSVTSVTNCASKYGLYWFYAIHGIRIEKNKKGEDRKVLVGEEVGREAAMIGTGVHDYISDDLRGLKLGSPDTKFKKPIDNFRKFQKKFDPEPLLVEQTIYSLCPVCVEGNGETPHLCTGYAGTLDLICRIKGEIVLLDWKTSKDIYDDYKLQVEAYYRAVCLMQSMDQLGLKEPVTKFMLVQLDKEKDFDYEKHVMKIDPNECRNFGFIGLLNYFRWSKILKSV